MRIAVIDGQGGGMGRSVIEKIRASFGHEVSIIALGTNAASTSAMMKAGADDGATGEHAIVYNTSRCDVIVGALGIIAANSFHGELSPAISVAVAESEAVKILIPINKCNLIVAGAKETMLSDYIDDAIKTLIRLRRTSNI
jgi:hypothetical protein